MIFSSASHHGISFEFVKGIPPDPELLYCLPLHASLPKCIKQAVATKRWYEDDKGGVRGFYKTPAERGTLPPSVSRALFNKGGELFLTPLGFEHLLAKLTKFFKKPKAAGTPNSNFLLPLVALASSSCIFHYKHAIVCRNRHACRRGLPRTPGRPRRRCRSTTCEPCTCSTSPGRSYNYTYTNCAHSASRHSRRCLRVWRRRRGCGPNFNLARNSPGGRANTTTGPWTFRVFGLELRVQLQEHTGPH